MSMKIVFDEVQTIEYGNEDGKVVGVYLEDPWRYGIPQFEIDEGPGTLYRFHKKYILGEYWDGEYEPQEGDYAVRFVDCGYYEKFVVTSFPPESTSTYGFYRAPGVDFGEVQKHFKVINDYMSLNYVIATVRVFSGNTLERYRQHRCLCYADLADCEEVIIDGEIVKTEQLEDSIDEYMKTHYGVEEK